MTRYALLDKSGKTRLTAEADDTRTARMRFKIARDGKPLPEGWTIVKRAVKPAKPKRTKFKVGDRVRVKASVECPDYGWGEVKRGDVGVVRRIDSDGGLVIDFPAHDHWLGVSSEMELAPKKAEPKKLAPGHVTLKMASGDTLEFWLELDSDGVLDLRGRTQGRPPRYVASILPSGVLVRHGNLDLPGLKVNSDGQVMM